MNYEGKPFKYRNCVVIISKDDGLWHMSISRKDRLPTYDELKSARYEFFPDVLYMIQIFPPVEEFVNLHVFTLHLWEPRAPFGYSGLRG